MTTHSPMDLRGLAEKAIEARQACYENKDHEQFGRVGMELSVATHSFKDASIPDDLRALGLTVAAHNDYRLNGKTYTFWLFTRDDGMSFKGESETDTEALNQIRYAISKEPT